MSSSDETDEDIPETSECQNRCLQFAEITGTDTACAQFYLQDRKWDLDQSVNDFFEDRAGKGALRINDKSEAEVVVVLDGSRKSLAAAATAMLVESATSHQDRRSGSPAPKKAKIEEEPPILKFITWNIDGLDEKNLTLRAKAVCKIIGDENADVVFLQEVIPETAEIFLRNMTDYDCLFGGEVGYFCGTLLKKSSIKYSNFDIIPFPNTRMMRNALRVNATFKNSPLCLLNSHLESTKDGVKERVAQLKMMFQNMMRMDDSSTVIFGGDLNLRESELKEMGGIPSGIEDMWISCGSRKECSYTWDMTRNDNLIWNQKFKPRSRFDRVYMRRSRSHKIAPKYFGLIGLERLLPHRCFPSDHWGIRCHFQAK